jgi:D-amino peptidase
VRLFIAVDREGVCGVVSEADTDRVGPAADAAVAHMRADLDAVLDGCFAAGAEHVVVCDAHDDGRSLQAADLRPGVTLMAGSPAPHSMMQGIGAGLAGALFVGYHARAGARAAVLEHTWNYRVYSVHVGELELGEFGLGALLAGHFGVPALFISGDEATAAEATALVPPITATVVKRGVSRYAAELLPPDEARTRLRADAERAVREAGTRTPLEWSGDPLRLTFTRVQYCDLAERCPGVQRLDGRTLLLRGDSYDELFRAFLTCLTLSETEG